MTTYLKSSQSSHRPQEVLLAQFSLYVHKGGLKPDSFHFFTYLKYNDDKHDKLDFMAKNTLLRCTV